jgi:hypothetical protein
MKGVTPALEGLSLMKKFCALLLLGFLAGLGLLGWFGYQSIRSNSNCSSWK